MKICIGITTTKNREKLFAETFVRLVENTPVNVSYKVYRDDKYEGIAIAKNRCMAKCMENAPDFIVLLDDDIYSLDIDWVYKYIESGLNHAMYIFDRPVVTQESNYTEYALPRGCMLFFTRHCIETAGGFDERFIKWGYEHAELSQRIYNMGLIPAPFIDISDSKGLFYSHDEHATCKSSVVDADRVTGIRHNKPLYEASILNNKFIPYK
ncbi:glycosyltransferase family 2 protein [Mucilaginibacter sp.]|jgi:glycosyltransferase involved in cell wall biosynthesis|uniref:glycosyltransferase family 2 protein n=1 Tax=Mucilaginibacter sp. TaxID=1882438 RepID=UPI0035658C83